jgi:hypothetical protein
MFVTFIPRASFPVSRQASQPYAPELLDQAVRRILRPSLAAARSHRRAINLVHSTCARNCWRTTMCMWTGVAQVIGNENQRGKFFWHSSSNATVSAADSQAAFRWPTLRQSLGGPFRFAVERVSFASAPFCTAKRKKRPDPTKANRNADQKRQEYRDPTQPRQRSLCRSRC